MSDHFGQMPHTVGVALKDMMAGSELLSHQLRGGQLIIKFAVGKTDAERLDRPLTALRSKGRDCAGIDSAAQEYTNRDIAHQPDSHRFIDKRADTRKWQLAALAIRPPVPEWISWLREASWRFRGTPFWAVENKDKSDNHEGHLHPDWSGRHPSREWP